MGIFFSECDAHHEGQTGPETKDNAIGHEEPSVALDGETIQDGAQP